MRDNRWIIMAAGVAWTGCAQPAPAMPSIESPGNVVDHRLVRVADSVKSQHVDIRFGAHPGYDRLVIEWPHPVHARIRVDRGTASISFDMAASLTAKRLQELLPATMAPVTVRPDGTQISFRLPPGRSIHDHSEGNLVILDILGGNGANPPTAQEAAAAVPPKPSPAEPAGNAVAPVEPPTPDAADEIEVASTADNQLTVTCAPIQEGFSFHFKWKHHAKLAVFKLRASEWIVFDRAEQLKFNPQIDSKLHIPALHQVENGSATVLELNDPHYRHVVVNDVETHEVDDSGAPLYEAGDNGGRIPVPDVDWIVDLQQQTAHDSAVGDNDSPALSANNGLYETRKPGQPVTVVDPDSGEVLLAIPVFTREHFADTVDNKTYIALPTVQGMLFRPEGDTAHFLIERGKDENGVRVINASPILTHSE
jgi:hypothetical protein